MPLLNKLMSASGQWWDKLGTVTSIAYSSSLGIWAVVGTNVGVITSSDAIRWAQPITAGMATALGFGSLGGIIWTGNNFAAIGGTAKSRIVTSYDGITWTMQSTNLSLSIQFSTLCSNGSIYVATDTIGNIYSSPDGINWTLRVAYTSIYSGASNFLSSNYLNGTFVLSGSTGSGGTNSVLFTSSDGITFSSNIAYASLGKIRYVSYGLSLHVAQGDLNGYGTQTRYQVSTNNYVTSTYDSLSNNILAGLLYFSPVASKFYRLIVAGNIFSSTDGFTWTDTGISSPSINGGINVIDFSGPLCVFLAFTGTASQIWTSTNGTTWVQRI